MSLESVQKGIGALAAISGTNGESCAKKALSFWASAQNEAEYSQQTADAIGQATVQAVAKWKAASADVLEQEYKKWKAEENEWGEKAKAYHKEWQAAVSEEQSLEVDNPEYERYREQKSRKETFGLNNPPSPTIVPIENRAAYAAAERREKQANENEKNAKKQKSNAASKASNAQKKLQKEQDSIDKFLLDVFELKFMNESVLYLSAIKSNNLASSSSAQDKLFSRLFFISNKYRKQFDEYGAILDANTEAFGKAQKVIKKDSISYSAHQGFAVKKVKGLISFKLTSKDTNSATEKFTSIKEFLFKKEKKDEGVAKLREQAKAWQVCRYPFAR